jgi:sugar lactone lactonase YvrE
VLPVTGLNSPVGLSWYLGESVVVTDASGSRMLWAQPQRDASTPPWQPAPAGSTVWVGPFTGLQSPHDVTTINSTTYVADSGNNRVMEYTTGKNAPEVATFTGLSNPTGLVVVNRGYPDLYVVDTGNNRVLELADGFNHPQTVLGFTGLNNPRGVAVDNESNVYVTDSGNNRVVRLSTDRNTQAVTQTILPFVGLNDPEGVFVDTSDNVYVVDTGNNRVLKLEKAFVGQ